MMKKCLCLIIYTIAFLSCTSKDGDWEPMEWEVDTSAYLKKDHIAVPEREELIRCSVIIMLLFGYHLCLRTVCKLKRTVLLEVLQKACGVLLKYAKMQ